MSESNAERVFGEIEKERDHQDRKWGEQNHDDLKWLAVLGEEFGEVSKAILESRKSTDFHIDHEIIQVAAVAAAWRECRLRRIDKEPPTQTQKCVTCGANFEGNALTQSSRLGLCSSCWLGHEKSAHEVDEQ